MEPFVLDRRLHPDHQGRGLATDAATGLLDLAFGDVGARRASASLDPRNHASASLCERLGMRREAPPPAGHVVQGGVGGHRRVCDPRDRVARTPSPGAQVMGGRGQNRRRTAQFERSGRLPRPA